MSSNSGRFNKRETSKIVEYKDRKFKINYFDPMTGNYILAQCLSFILPLGISDALFGANPGSENIKPKGSSGANMMPKEQFISLQKDILCTIEEVYDSGNTSPVVRQNGTYGVDGVTMGLLVHLIVTSLIFNFESFFEDIQSIQDIIPDQISNFASTRM